MKNQKNQIAEDTLKIANLTDSLKRLDKLIETFKTEFNSLPPDAFIKNKIHLLEALKDPTALYKAALMARMPETDVTGLPINKAERLKTLTLPNLTKIEALKTEISTLAKFNNIELDKLYSGTEMTQDVNYVEALKDAHRLFANDDVESKFVEKHNALVEAFIDCKAHFEKHYSHSFFTPNQFDIYTLIKEGRFNPERLRAARNFRIS